MDAPREVWIISTGRRDGDHCKAFYGPNFGGDRYVRADLAPSAQPSSDQVRRLAEAYKALAVSAGDLNEEEESALKLSEAVLASPEAPAIDSEARHARVREEAEAASKALTMAVHALRSYQHFNSSTDLAKSAADHCEPVLSALRAALEDK